MIPRFSGEANIRSEKKFFSKNIKKIDNNDYFKNLPYLWGFPLSPSCGTEFQEFVVHPPLCTETKNNYEFTHASKKIKYLKNKYLKKYLHPCMDT